MAGHGMDILYSTLSLSLFFFLAVPRSMQDLSFPTRDGTPAPCSGSMES